MSKSQSLDTYLTKHAIEEGEALIRKDWCAEEASFIKGWSGTSFGKDLNLPVSKKKDEKKKKNPRVIKLLEFRGFVLYEKSSSLGSFGVCQGGQAPPQRCACDVIGPIPFRQLQFQRAPNRPRIEFRLLTADFQLIPA